MRAVTSLGWATAGSNKRGTAGGGYPLRMSAVGPGDDEGAAEQQTGQRTWEVGAASQEPGCQPGEGVVKMWAHGCEVRCHPRWRHLRGVRQCTGTRGCRVHVASGCPLAAARLQSRRLLAVCHWGLPDWRPLPATSTWGNGRRRGASGEWEGQKPGPANSRRRTGDWGDGSRCGTATCRLLTKLGRPSNAESATCRHPKMEIDQALADF